MRFLILTLLAAACPLTAVAAIYSWTDTQGRQHFSDDPLLAERHAGVLYQPGTPSASSTPLVRPQPRNTSRKTARKTPRSSTSKANSRERRASASISANKACQRYERQIDALTRKLRRAHSNRQGNQWREQRRFYQHKRWQSCS